MIHAFAIEPEVAASWSDFRVFRLIIGQFGIGTPRAMLELPKFSTWKKAVYQVGSGLGDLERTRLAELFSRLGECRVKRSEVLYDGTVPWLDNAETEHDRRAFSAIIASENPRGHAGVLLADQVGDTTDSRWQKSTAETPTRTAEALTGAVSAMLENCSEMHIVDPHFSPGNRRHRVVIEALLAVARRTPALKQVTVHCTAKGTLDCFNTAAEGMARRLPRDVTVSFKRWRENDREKLHNRYLLTNLGGVTFGVGLDEGSAAQTDDVNLMSREQYELRWSQFADENGAFALVDEPQQIHGASS